MKKKLDLPPDPDRPPAMFVGDELTGSLPQTQGAAAVLPDDLRVVLEGTSAGRLLLIVVALLAAVGLGMYVLDWLSPPDLAYGLQLVNNAFVAAGGAVLAWLAHRILVRRHREFRLLDDGITVEVTPLVGGPLRVTHIPWTDIADYTVSVQPEKAFLGVVSIRGYTLTLKERPPSSFTREFIHRFTEQADRYPRAAELEPRAAGSLPDVTGERPPALGGCLAFLAITMAAGSAKVFVGLSHAQEMTAVAAVGLIVITFAFWLDLDDPEIAGKDAESNRLIARLRSWLRRVLGIRVT